MRKLRQTLALAVLGVGTFGFHPVQAQPQEAWAARYDGPGNYVDAASDVALDDSGNIYVTGTSVGATGYYDYATLKYDAEGRQLWVARYDGSGNYYDSTSALAIDAAGNAYVTGGSYGLGGFLDWATVKYSADGQQVWVSRHNGPGNYLDEAFAIVLDSAGNPYVAGKSYGLGSDEDYLVIKYDPEGHETWSARYNGPGNYADAAHGLALDSAGNVYVTGTSYGGSSYYDWATVKYDLLGQQVWVARYNGPGNQVDAPSAVAVDHEGAIYVAGTSVGSGTLYDYTTVKYDPAGNQLWAARYNGPGNSYDSASALAIEGSGSVYVTGKSYGIGTDYDFATVKYDGEGNQVWVERYNGPGDFSDEAYALAVDGEGGVYVAGRSHGPGSFYDYLTLKYGPSGDPEWEARYNGPGNYSDEASALAADRSGNVYVAGRSFGSGTSFDCATVKYARETGIEEQGPVRATLPRGCIRGASPNPFTTAANIECQFSEQWLEPLRLAIFDVRGRCLREFVLRGSPAISWDGLDRVGKSVPSGVYICQLRAGHRGLDTKRIVRIRP
jgi:hypothetical protein